MVELRCPETGQPLHRVTYLEAEHLAGPLHQRPGSPFSNSQSVLIREDHTAAYPVSDVPVLLVPEALTPQALPPNLTDPLWAEAYDEMSFYNSAACEDDISLQAERFLATAAASPFPGRPWADAPYDFPAQLDAYRHLDPVRGTVVAQLGGKGLHAIKLLLAGASEAWLVTPMIGEALYACRLASTLDLADRFNAVVAIAEQLPFADSVFDRIYSGGSVHHMECSSAAKEILRTLTLGGRFAAVDPWRTPLHTIGTALVGQREKGVHCHPLTAERLRPFKEAFPECTIEPHGPLLRYVALGLQACHIPVRYSDRLAALDDAVPAMRRLGGSVALLAAKR